MRQELSLGKVSGGRLDSKIISLFYWEPVFIEDRNLGVFLREKVLQQNCKLGSTEVTHWSSQQSNTN